MDTTRTAVTVVAASAEHPDRSLTNADLEATVPGLAPGWIDEHLGIDSRRVLATHEQVSQLARDALTDALARSGWDGTTLDAIICSTSMPDDLLPATASLVADGIAPQALAFDVNAACAGGLLGVGLARALLTDNPAMRRVAVLTAERPTAWIDYRDPRSSVFWGDSAGCVLLERGATPGGFALVGLSLANDNTGADQVRVRRGAPFHHDGRLAYKMVVKLTSQLGHEVLAEAGVAPTDVRAFVGHQSNTRLLTELSDVLGIPFSRQWHHVEWAGNQTSSGVLTAFAAGWERDRADLRDGDHVLLAAVGGGFSAGAVLLRWTTAPG